MEEFARIDFNAMSAHAWTDDVCVETEYMRAAQSLMWLAGFPLSQEYTDVLPGVPGKPRVLAQVLPMLVATRPPVDPERPARV